MIDDIFFMVILGFTTILKIKVIIIHVIFILSCCVFLLIINTEKKLKKKSAIFSTLSLEILAKNKIKFYKVISELIMFE